MKFNLVLFFGLLLVLLSPDIFAQAHNTDCMHCKFSKSHKSNLPPNTDPYSARASSECGCAACSEKSKKEIQARQEEEKVQATKRQAEFEAKKKAQEEERARQAELEKSKANSGRVVLGGSFNLPENTTTQAPKVKQESNFGYMWHAGLYYRDVETGEIIREEIVKQWRGLGVLGPSTVQELKNNNNKAYFLHPPRLATARIDVDGYCNGWWKPVYDLVDYDLNRVLNNDSINYVEHFFADWFVVLFYDCNRMEKYSVPQSACKLYNVDTKEYVNLIFPASFENFELHHGRKWGEENNSVYHNPHYASGQYRAERVNFRSMHLPKFYDMIDEVTGGKAAWKSAIIVSLDIGLKGRRVYYLVALEKDDKIKFYPVTTDQVYPY